MLKSIPNVQDLVSLAIREDLNRGDITTEAFSAVDRVVTARIVLEEAGIIAGLDLVALVCEALRINPQISRHTQDGATESAGKVILTLRGSAVELLMAERVILNFLARLSGIATASASYVAQVARTRCRLLDTRKTTPGWRYLDKYATHLGGVVNHRFGLDDGILIKDNHLCLSPSLTEAVEMARRHAGPLQKIAVEVETPSQVLEALGCGVDHLLLDNMGPSLVAEMVKLIAGKAGTEASGGITLANLKEYAATGVDYISLGSLTTQVRFLNLKLEFVS